MAVGVRVVAAHQAGAQADDVEGPHQVHLGGAGGGAAPQTLLVTPVLGLAPHNHPTDLGQPVTTTNHVDLDTP